MPDPIVNLRGGRPDVPSPYEYTKDLLNNQTGGNTGVDPLERLKGEVFAPVKGPQAEQPNFLTSKDVDQTGRYPWYMPGQDNEDIYGQGQGVFSKAGHAIFKGLNLAGTTFLQGTIGP